jgi:ABC-type Fe3+ transport system permease subunit
VQRIRQRLTVFAVIAGVVGLGCFALGLWLSIHETFGSFGAGSGDITDSGSAPTFSGPSTWSLVAQTTLTALGVVVLAVAVVAVAGIVATVVVDYSRARLDDPDHLPPAWPHEVVDNGT